MLQNTFFNFTSLQNTGDIFTTHIELNKHHEIFKGHFPEQPVLPGACMIQMVKEVAESYAGSPIQLIKADNIKFLSFVDPSQNNLIQMELKITRADERLRIDAQLLDNTNVLFKFKGSFAEK